MKEIYMLLHKHDKCNFTVFSSYDDLVKAVVTLVDDEFYVDTSNWVGIDNALQQNTDYHIDYFATKQAFNSFMAFEFRERELGDDADVKDPHPDYGHLMTIEEWKEAVSCGAFVRSDGSGYYAHATTMSRLSVWINPWDVPSFEDYGFTHVVWFNK